MVSQSFAECKGIMLHRGSIFYEKLVAARGKVGKVAAHFITDGCVSTNTSFTIKGTNDKTIFRFRFIPYRL